MSYIAQTVRLKAGTGYPNSSATASRASSSFSRASRAAIRTLCAFVFAASPFAVANTGAKARAAASRSRRALWICKCQVITFCCKGPLYQADNVAVCLTNHLVKNYVNVVDQLYHHIFAAASTLLTIRSLKCSCKTHLTVIIPWLSKINEAIHPISTRVDKIHKTVAKTAEKFFSRWFEWIQHNYSLLSHQKAFENSSSSKKTPAARPWACLTQPWASSLPQSLNRRMMARMLHSHGRRHLSVLSEQCI
ncbi:hypothetical protein BC830DRAFT_738482 [Chytriomyces sp. MP71]|nr:hypothetical protein BC830DRAFT_738482 [Chytriomyces sp. MP71]